jgi:hypothetical protein
MRCRLPITPGHLETILCEFGNQRLKAPVGYRVVADVITGALAAWLAGGGGH